LGRIPLDRGAESADIAAAIVFLASDDARQITGIEYAIDGGMGAG
jgi:NAD(P)-dependent dehydrogenase (short-subunit alcohol dehydrogenase family)